MNQPGICRRRVLATLGGTGMAAIAGCSGGDGVSSTTVSGAATDGATATRAAAETSRTAADTPTATEGTDSPGLPAGHDYYVTTGGSADNPGTRAAPFGAIAEAIQEVAAGESIYVDSGEYQELLEVGTDGTAEQPIELTGPADAVLRRPSDQPAAMLVGGDHVHVTGLSITGLADPSRAEDPEAYADAPLVMVTTKSFDTYNRGAVIAPHRIGDSGAQLVKFRFCRDAEAGPFRVAGRAGAKWQLSGSGHPSGEIVYVGTSPSTIEKAPVESWDRTRNVRVHHVDNAAGHPHGQLVDVKPGTENVTVEYCTDGGGSHNNKDWEARSIAVRGHAATVRWNRLQNGEGVGIGVGSGHNNDPENEVQERAGEDNEIYGNEITGFGEESIWFPYDDEGPGQAPEDQAIYCGNTVDGPADGNPASACPADVPSGDGVGHTGGDVPGQ